jgi:mycothiol synthase
MATASTTHDAGPESPAPYALRPFDPDRDFPEVVELIGEVSRHDGEHQFPTVESLAVEWAPNGRHQPALDIRVAEDGDRVVGVVRHSWREREQHVQHRIETWVHPERRRQGLGRRLLEWAEARARESVRDGSGGPTHRSHVFGGAISEVNPAAVAFAAATGYSPARYHFEMRRPLGNPIPEVPLPAGLELRPVLPEHHRAIWDADEEAFRDHWDAAVVTDDDYVQFFSDPDLDTSLWQVAWAGDEVAGLVINGIYPHENERMGLRMGWVDSVATRRPWRRRGVAGALIARSLAILRDRGMEQAVLGVDTENPTGALGLYERFGFTPRRSWVFLRKGF